MIEKLEKIIEIVSHNAEMGHIVGVCEVIDFCDKTVPTTREERDFILTRLKSLSDGKKYNARGEEVNLNVDGYWFKDNTERVLALNSIIFDYIQKGLTDKNND
jgi:hypothetical protein